MMVTDTSGHHLVNRENIEKEGKFAFTTDKDDIFEICFISRVPSNVRGSRQEVILGLVAISHNDRIRRRKSRLKEAAT